LENGGPFGGPFQILEICIAAKPYKQRLREEWVKFAALDFESGTSANSIISAYLPWYYSILIKEMQEFFCIYIVFSFFRYYNID